MPARLPALVPSLTPSTGLAAQAAEAPTPPMNFLQAFGDKASVIASLTWAMLILSIGVVVVITTLTVIGVLKRKTAVGALGARFEPILRPSGGLSWITIGVSVSTAALFGAMVWNAYTMAAIDKPPRDPALTIQVIAHQWWWEFRYRTETPSESFQTANEAHIPLGEPVRVEVESTDVIHSFWTPALGDKIDVIPGQTNRTWFEANTPGVYRGQCSEYCGKQHAHMGIVIVAESPEQFRSWRDAQLQTAASISSAGEALFVARCGACHTVRGTRAWGMLGPDLTHLMSRAGIAANTLPNTPANLSGWIADPQRIKPGAKMPMLALSAPELSVIRDYLETLK